MALQAATAFVYAQATGADTRASAQPLSSEELAAFIDPIVEQQLESRKIAGAIVVVVHEGAVRHSKGYGLADVAGGRPMRADTVTRLASVSKLLTAMAVMQLVDAGTLDLDRDVNEYLDFHIPASSGIPLTVRHLLSHRSGFAYRIGGIASLSGGRSELGPFLRQHLPPFLHANGGIVGYSNYAFSLAAYIVERISKERFEDYLARHVFQPLGMERTTAEQPAPASVLAVTSNGYERSDRPATPISMGAATIHEVGSTGVVASGVDIGRLMRALLDPAAPVISAAALTAMTSSQVDAPTGFVGLGSYSPVAAGGNPFVGQDGGTGGFHNSLALLPERRLGIFVSYNSAGLPGGESTEGELMRRFAARYFPGIPATTPSRVRATPRDDDATGVYEPTRRTDSSFFALGALWAQLALRHGVEGRVVMRPAFLPTGGVKLERVAPGMFRGRDRQVSVLTVDGRTELQIGAPVARYVRASRWRNAAIVVPAVLACLVFSVLTVLMWPITAVRRRHAGWHALDRRLFNLSRLALALDVGAIAAAVWLVAFGWPHVATSSSLVTPLVVSVYAAAWAGVLLAPLAVWGAIRGWQHTIGTRTARVGQTLAAVVAVLLSAFCVAWRIAGATLSL